MLISFHDVTNKLTLRGATGQRVLSVITYKHIIIAIQLKQKNMINNVLTCLQ